MSDMKRFRYVGISIIQYNGLWMFRLRNPFVLIAKYLFYITEKELIFYCDIDKSRRNHFGLLQHIIHLNTAYDFICNGKRRFFIQLRP